MIQKTQVTDSKNKKFKTQNKTQNTFLAFQGPKSLFKKKTNHNTKPNWNNHSPNSADKKGLIKIQLRTTYSPSLIKNYPYTQCRLSCRWRNRTRPIKLSKAPTSQLDGARHLSGIALSLARGNATYTVFNNRRHTTLHNSARSLLALLSFWLLLG